MNVLKKWVESQKTKSNKQHIDSMRDEFRVKEKDGKIWLTHYGIAFKEIPPKSTAEDIAKELEDARKTALRFEGLWS